ncbi:hypothetical protein ACFWDB_00420 [Micromonospora chalcea]|uniref:hypothetical protein n=1 Tax=Micromonospora sp. TSRI0369 TaxID=1703936 RepID=UPI000A7A685D|nr:hypothetical protein [Micromonospora sp. TSRI0369]
MKSKKVQIKDSLPCLHRFPSEKIPTTKEILRNLSQTHPEILEAAQIEEEDWIPLLRATVERMRGETSASGADKKRFIHAVLDHCLRRGDIVKWDFIGTGGRQDYRVDLLDGTTVAIEAKGCPDGNNTTIWDRPSWADEFVVWSLCPESLAKPPGEGAWAGISTRLMPKIVAERKVVDSFIFFDARCGTSRRECPKAFGVTGDLRAEATDFEGQEGKEDWVPPPCIYLFPRSNPSIPHNQQPPLHTLNTSRFPRVLLNAFNVPEVEHEAYVHSAEVGARGSAKGTQIQVSVTSRCWPDGEERTKTAAWKPLKRET